MSKGKKVIIIITALLFILTAVTTGVYFILNREYELKGKEGEEYKKEFIKMDNRSTKQIEKVEDYDMGTEYLKSNVYSILYDSKGNIVK